MTSYMNGFVFSKQKMYFFSKKKHSPIRCYDSISGHHEETTQILKICQSCDVMMEKRFFLGFGKKWLHPQLSELILHP